MTNRQIKATFRAPYLGTLGLVPIIFGIGAITTPHFASISNIETILIVSSILGIITVGQMLVIVSGGTGVDLSIPWVLNAAGIAITQFAFTHISALTSWAMAIIIGGAVIGLISGTLIVVFELPPMIVTLAISGIIEGLVLVTTGGTPNGVVPPLLTRAINSSLLGISTPDALWLFESLAVGGLLGWTFFGRVLVAAGNNPRATWLSGIDYRLRKALTYAISGALAATGGIVLTAYVGESYLGMGDPYLLSTIAAAVIGGTAIYGGRGSLIGTAAGAVVLTEITSLLNIFNIGSAERDIFYGLILMAALLIYAREKREA